MRIAIDCRLWNEGGVGRYIRNLTYYLKKLDRENQYTLFFLNSPPVKTEANFLVKTTLAKWHSLREQWVFYKELSQEKFDLVHFPYFSHPVLYNRPFVITVHDLTIKHFATGKATTKSFPVYWLKRWGYSWVLSHAVNQSAHVLVPSGFVKKDILKHFVIPEKKITITYEGLGVEFLQNKTKQVNLGDHKYLLYVGNFYPHKNVSLLLQLLTELRDQKLHLVLVGPQDYFSQLMQQQVKRLKLDKQVSFKFQANELELAWLYEHAQALILPSFFEGFGLPIVEAAYYGCPLILSDIAVFREIAPKTAKFFPPHSLSSLKQALVNLKDQIDNKPLPDYFHKFSFKSLAQQTLTVYKQQTK